MMDFAELMRVLAPAVTVLVALGGLAMVILRWVVRDSNAAIEQTLTTLSADVRATLTRLETTVAHHDRELERLNTRVDSLRDDKAGKGELDLRVQVEVQREVGKILASAPHNISRTATPGG